MRQVALTGGIATGKSHVRAQFERLGVRTIDADIIARDLVSPDSPGLAAVVKRFGAEVIDPSGALDRRKLGSIVFADPVARRDLEQIIHPGVRAVINDWFATLPEDGHGFAIADIPLLFETGRDRDFDDVVVAACEPETQIQRVIERDHVTEPEARQRLAAQIPIEDKIERAEYVIYTDGSFDETNRQVDGVYKRLLAG